ncbi:MAG: hypothetical protein MUE85_17850 [Microscillaceae bacterium]|jgi:hypothetical protein|nr:hypothetical protein [Microscillaceae bacterium]
MKYAFYSLFALLLFVVVSCQKTNDLLPAEEDAFVSEESLEKTAPEGCGGETRLPLVDANNVRVGRLLFYNDYDNLVVHFILDAEYRLEKTFLFAGDCASKPTLASSFPLQNTFSPRIRSYTYTIPLKNLPKCLCISAYAEVAKIDLNTRRVVGRTNVWAKAANYSHRHCVTDCSRPCEIAHRSQTQGGWGSTPNGGNPGAYLHANFASVGSITIGNTCGFTATFNTAQAITDFLPQGGTAQALGFNSVNPTTVTGGKQNNVFAGQVLALSISVALDNAVPSFSPSSTPLVDLVVGDENSVFYGKSVGQILNWANLAIAGCTSPYAISDLNDVVDAINNNFVDGTKNLGFLVCAKDIKK